MTRLHRRTFIKTGIATGGVVVFGAAIRRGDRTASVENLVASDGETLFDVWLKISPDNTVTAIIPHAEMGQGVHTSLAMMLADELDADWSSVTMQEAPAIGEYANYALGRGYTIGDTEFPAWLVDSVNGFYFQATRMIGVQQTGGSLSVRTTGQIAMRTIGAAARSVLLQAAADEMQVPVGDLVAKNSVITHPATARTATYAQLAPAAAKINIPDKPTLKDSSAFRVMGTSPHRLDVPAKVDGSAKYGIDAALPNMKYAAIKGAPVFGGKVRSVDESSIQDMPGIRKVISLGDAVAVVADGYWQAHQAIAQLKIEFSGGANDRNQSGIFERFSRDLDRSADAHNVQIDFLAGDSLKALAKATTSVAAEYRVPFLAHSTMEPMNCTAWIHDDKCELWLGTQDPLGFANKTARAIGFTSDNVIVHNQYLGGGFGRRSLSDYAEQAAQIAAQVNYPVKLIWSREEDTRHDHYRQACISRFRGGLDGDGKATAWHNHYVNKHDPWKATRIPYAIDNQRIVHTVSRTPVPWGIWRSVDHSLHAFFTESFIDELANAAGRDSYQYRRDLLASAPRFKDVLDLAARKAGWDEPLPKYFGRGISIHKSYGTIVSQVAEVEVRDGNPRVHRVVCAVDAGFAIHPDGLKAQMESGIAYGLTAALHGEISIRQGAVEQSNFHDYPMLRMNEAPAIETFIINSGKSLGGGGEPGTPPIAPAVTNAIFDATGIRIRELPIRKNNLRSEQEHDRH